LNRPQIVICLAGGVVQHVYAEGDEAEVILVDWNLEHHDADRPEIVRFLHLGRNRRGLVTTLLAEPLWKLAGSDLEADIEAAEHEGLLAGSSAEADYPEASYARAA